VATKYLPEPTTAAEVLARARAVKLKRKQALTDAGDAKRQRQAAPDELRRRQEEGPERQGSELLRRAADAVRQARAAAAAAVTTERRDAVPVHEIVKETAKRFDVSVMDILSGRRARGVVIPRQTAMFLSRELALCSLPEIGRRLNGRDHTTVLHAVRKIGALIQTDPDLTEKVADIREALTGRREQE